MVWIVGIIGLIAGFGGGLACLKRWLKGTSREELLNNRDLRVRYGLFVWLVAAVTSAAAVFLYKSYF